MEATFAAVFFCALSIFVLYWVIRLAVLHAIQAADKHQRGGA
jgi:hypothetical protein